jgi:hypothetical protein
MLRWEGFFQPPDRDFSKLLKTALFLFIPAAEPGDVKANVKKPPCFCYFLRTPIQLSDQYF